MSFSRNPRRNLFGFALMIIVASIALVLLGVIYDRTIPRDPYRADAVTKPPFTSLT